MNVEKNEMVIVLDCGKDIEEVAAEASCCLGKPVAASSGDSIH